MSSSNDDDGLAALFGGIAPQREEARDAGIQELADEGRGSCPGVADAGEMRERLDVRLAEDVGQQLQGSATGRAAGAVGHRDEARVDAGQMADGLVQRGDTGLGARRVDLERDGHRWHAQIDRHGGLLGIVGGQRPGGRDTSHLPDRRWGIERAGAGLGCRSCPAPDLSGASSRTTGRRLLHGSGAATDRSFL